MLHSNSVWRAPAPPSWSADRPHARRQAQPAAPRWKVRTISSKPPFENFGVKPPAVSFFDPPRRPAASGGQATGGILVRSLFHAHMKVMRLHLLFFGAFAYLPRAISNSHAGV